MVCFLVIGDPHFKTSNVEETGALHTQTENFLKHYPVDFIVCLGDILDTHERIHLDPFHRAIEFLKMLARYAPSYLLIGNHDRRNNSDYLSGIHAFCGVSIKNLTIVDKVEHSLIDGMDFVFVPYVPPGRFEESLQTCSFDYKQSRCIFAHQEFKGCKMGAIISENGDPWPTELPLVVSGHIHDFQVPQPNIIYTGTPLQHAFGDSDDKSLFLFSMTKGDMSIQRVTLLIDKKVIVHIDRNEFESFRPKEHQVVKLVVHGTPEELKVVKSSEHSNTLKKMGVKVFFKARDVTDTTICQEIRDLKKREQLTFETVLFRTVQDDPEMVEMYKEIITP